MTKVLIISKTDLRKDPRPNRQIENLNTLGCEIYTYSLEPSKQKVAGHFNLNHSRIKGLGNKLSAAFLTITRQWEKIYWQAFQLDNEVLNEDYDIVIAHDIITTPLALKIIEKQSGHAKLFIDLHEYLPRQFEDQVIWNLVHRPYAMYLCQKYLPKADKTTTVCESIADEYHKIFKIERPTVITNAAKYHDLEPQKIGGKIKIITHGVAFRSRNIEKMIDVMEFLPQDKYELTLMLVHGNDDIYWEELKTRASKFENISFVPAVPFDEIIPFCNNFDIGLFLLMPVNFNYEHALPNKFFEFVQSRLCIAIGPSVEMKNVLEKNNLGIVSDTFEPRDLAERILSKSKAEIFEYKSNSNIKATTLSKEVNDEKFQGLIKTMTH